MKSNKTGGSKDSPWSKGTAPPLANKARTELQHLLEKVERGTITQVHLESRLTAVDKNLLNLHIHKAP